MRRRIAFAGMLLLMLGQPMNATAGQEVPDDIPQRLPSSGARFVPGSVHARAVQDEPGRRAVAEDHEAGRLAGL
jgi:hypothetical protein